MCMVSINRTVSFLHFYTIADEIKQISSAKGSIAEEINLISSAILPSA